MKDLAERVLLLAFEKGGADYLLAMREAHGNVAPVFIGKGEGLDDVRLDVPYQLVTVLSRIYPWIPEGKIALICRRCDEKALAELAKRDIIDMSRIVKIGLACDATQIERCRCSDPAPAKSDLGTAANGLDEDALSVRLEALDQSKRLSFWVDQFRKCNKCFACTLNCPVCVCDACVLGERRFVPEPGIPPGLSFHMIRAFHLADKCVECGECERSCPVDIPLLSLRKMLRKDMESLFGYVPGDPEGSSPLLTTLDDQPLEGDPHEC